MLSTLIYPEVPILKVELKDKVKGARKGVFELFLQQTRMSDPIEILSNVEQNTPAVLSPLEGRRNGIGDAKTFLNSRVEESETKLVERNDLLHLKDREKEEIFGNVGEEWQATVRLVGAWVVKRFIGFRNNWKTSIRVEKRLFG